MMHRLKVFSQIKEKGVRTFSGVRCTVSEGFLLGVNSYQIVAPSPTHNLTSRYRNAPPRHSTILFNPPSSSSAPVAHHAHGTTKSRAFSRKRCHGQLRRFRPHRSRTTQTSMLSWLRLVALVLTFFFNKINLHRL